MRAAGVLITSSYPHLGNWVEKGLTVELALEVIQLIRLNPGFSDRSIPANYIKPKIEDYLNPSKPATSSKVSWWSSDDGVMNKGQELSTQARPGEDMASYKARLFEAEKNKKTHDKHE